MRSHRDLDVYKLAIKASMRIFHRSKQFPKVERYSLIDQIRRSSRSVCANLAEAFRKRKYPGSFVVKLNDAEMEAAETQTWLDFALRCKYITKDEYVYINEQYDHILSMLVKMSQYPEKWQP